MQWNINNKLCNLTKICEHLFFVLLDYIDIWIQYSLDKYNLIFFIPTKYLQSMQIF